MPLILILLLMSLGLCVLLYPTASNILSKITSTVTIKKYNAAVSQIDESKRKAMWKAAQEYNATISGIIKTDAFAVGNKKTTGADAEYMSLLNIDDGIMGYIDIPSINVYLPVYHGTTTAILQKGAGHLEGSALPVGGAGTNAVITAHRGLPSAKFFTDLDQLEIGDYFYLHVLDQTLAYKVDKISVIEPKNTQALDAVPGEDHATLLTCTPYGINTQRLVIRGIRVKWNGKDTSFLSLFDGNELQLIPLWVIILAGILLFTLLRALRLLRRRRRRL